MPLNQSKSKHFPKLTLIEPLIGKTLKIRLKLLILYLKFENQKSDFNAKNLSIPLSARFLPITIFAIKKMKNLNKKFLKKFKLIDMKIKKYK